MVVCLKRHTSVKHNSSEKVGKFRAAKESATISAGKENHIVFRFKLTSTGWCLGVEVGHSAL